MSPRLASRAKKKPKFFTKVGKNKKTKKQKFYQGTVTFKSGQPLLIERQKWPATFNGEKQSICREGG
jgi:hypothetical protein